jgi:hypothetical protein
MPAAGTLGARLYFSNSALTDIESSADEITDFRSLTINIELGLIESFSELGKVFANVNFQAVGIGRQYKYKGGFNNGNIQLTVGQDLSDTGQGLLRNYANTSDQSTYPFKITLTGADENFDTIYFGAKVMGFRTQMGNVNSVIKGIISMEINTEIFIGNDTVVLSRLALGSDLLTLGLDQLVLGE